MNFDTIVAALTLGVAGLPVASLVWKKPSGKILALAFVLSSGTAFGVFFLAQTYWPEARGEHVVKDRPVESVEDGFVSSTTCRSCHPRNHATWYQSYHRTMTQVATPETVVGRFDGAEQIAYDNKKFRLGRTGDEFWFEGPDLSQPGKRMRRPIVMTTGLHHMQAYWYATGKHREVGIVPFFYLMEDQRWAPSYSTFLRPPHAAYEGETGGWNRVCQRCHATGVQPRIHDPDAPDTRVAEFGIACEACHGRAEEHVRINRDPRRRYRLHFSDDPDPTIVNPSRLSPRLASQICGQCHSISTPRDVEKWKQLGYPYRPGSDLLTTRFVSPGKLDREDLGAEDRSTLERILKFGPTFLKDRFWDDGMVRISGREYHGLLDSPCYKDADSEDRMLSCLSCHTMHQAAEDSRPVKEWANDQLTSGMDGDEACLQCHESFAASLTSHTHHRADSEGSRCYNCHMPHTTYGLLKAIRSHTIDSPNVAVDLETGRPNACNLCHLDKTLQWTADHLDRWYEIPAPGLPEGHKTVAASVSWVLRGDAGQRALLAWSMGWKPAQETSKTDWLPLYLVHLLNDPYDVVRYVAYRSLRTLARYDRVRYDFMGPVEERLAGVEKLLQMWKQRPLSKRTTGTHLLIDNQGVPLLRIWEQIAAQRDDRRVHLEE